MKTFDYVKKHVPTAKQEEWHQHFNGGGWVANSAFVEKTVHVDPEAIVFGKARVLNHVVLKYKAIVGEKAMVSDNAIISRALIVGTCRITDCAVVQGNEGGGQVVITEGASLCNSAKTVGNSRIGGNASLFGNAEVGGFAVVEDDAKVGDYVYVLDHALVCGAALLRGALQLRGHSEVRAGVWDYTPFQQYLGITGFINICAPSMLKIGHYIESIDWWLNNIGRAAYELNYHWKLVTEGLREEVKEVLQLIKRLESKKHPSVVGACG